LPKNALITMAAMAADYLSYEGFPGGATLGEAARRIVAWRLERALGISLDELRRGKRDIVDVSQHDEVAAILFRYQRAAIEGTARLNLRLMASIAAGQSARGRIVADEFLAWSDSIANLRREEVILLIEMLRAEQEVPSNITPAERNLWPLTGKWEAVQRVVVPDPFSSLEEVLAAAAAASRSGLVAAVSGSIDMPVTFATTSRLATLIDLAPLEDALGREGYSRPLRERRD
jgi:hypothetical protein